jgi:hypothetical protein
MEDLGTTDRVRPVAGVGYIILEVSRNASLSYFAVYMAAWWVLP